MGEPPRKPDADAIRVFLDRLSRAPGLSPAQRWWAGRLFHVTDVNNAAAILAGGELFAHNELVQRRLPFVSASAGNIMEETGDWVHDCVRLYFRPRTPTFHRNEGLRPASAIQDGAHCPVPVALIFDAARIMASDGVRWSRHNLAKHVPNPWLGEDAGSLEAMDFATIYHDGPLPEDLKAAVISARQAEVIVPQRLSTDTLIGVVTRSEADRKTLRTLLTDRRVTQERQRPILTISGVNPALFHGEWTAIHDVQRHGGWVNVFATAGLWNAAAFTADIVWTGLDRVDRRNIDPLPYDPRTILRLPVPADLADRPARLTLRLDGALAFTGWFRPEGEFLIPPAP